MSRNNDLISNNIFNLTTLWKLTGESCGLYRSIGNVNISQAQNSDWPSRIWLSHPTDLNNDMTTSVLSSKQPLKLSVFGGNPDETTSILRQKLNTEKSIHQTGMYLPKPWLYDYERTIQLVKVKDAIHAEIWCDLFKEAFEYTIPPKVIIKTSKFANYYLAQANGQNIGTVMLFTDSNNNAGIHSLGVPPAFRRRGFAKAITISAIQLLIKVKTENIFLQASDAAVNLYRELGFKDQFEMNTYSFSSST